MQVLIILSTGLMGGVERHVQCLAKTILEQSEELHVRAEVLIVGELGPIGEAMRQQGITVHSFGCRSCHDWRIFPKLRRLLKECRPDVVSMQGLLLFPTLYFKLFAPSVPLTRSIHTPTVRESWPRHLLWSWLGRRFDWNLPVSSETWRNFIRVYPWAEGRGEVFFNPVRLSDFAKYKKPTLNPQPSIFNLPSRRRKIRWLQLLQHGQVHRGGAEGWC